MLKNKNIYLNSYHKFEEIDQLQLTKYCEWPNCQKKGIYRAPSSRENLRVFRYFCLEHVKEYNRAWDYFKGRPTDQIYDEVSNDAYWHRKTNKKINNFKLEDNFNFFQETFNKKERRVNSDKFINNNIKASLKILEVKNLNSIYQLKKQYKKMVKLFHPDLNKLGSNEKIIKLNEAYSCLLDFLKK